MNIKFPERLYFRKKRFITQFKQNAKRKTSVIYYRCGKMLWIMTFLFFMGYAALYSKQYYRQKDFEDAFPLGMEAPSFDEYMESQKYIPSDIEGLSVYDKYMSGLQHQNGSDSDYDGLTDKEEIEVYGTDPLKASSAGDLYTDAYKVQNGINPYTYLEYNDLISFPYQDCEEIQLTASCPIDFNAVVTDCTGEYDLDSFDIGIIYKTYMLYNYAGKIIIDVHSIMENSSLNNLEIYVAYGPFIIQGETNLTKCNYKIDENMIILDYEFEHGYKYLLFLADKEESFINSYNPLSVTMARSDTAAVDTGFDKYKNELPFQNFRSYIGTSGNCAGITHLTSYLYNTGSFPSSGSYICNIDGTYQAVNWDLSTDGINMLLTEPYLYDYKSADFVNEHSSGSGFLNSNLSDGEMEFIDMIGCLWTEASDRIDLNEYKKASGEYYDVSLLKSMTFLLDQGKILDVYLYMRGGGSHAVNLYGYEYIKEDCVRFKVYDSNIPQDYRAGYKVNTDKNGNCFLDVLICKDETGNDVLEYFYQPLYENNIYLASSMNNLMPENVMIVMDENWNVLNE